MQVKGVALSSIIRFVNKNFCIKYDEWFASLEEETQTVFKDLKHTQWYDIKYLKEATKKACDMFYGGDARGAWDMGKESADFSLNGIYRIFVKVGSPNFIISRASRIIKSFYNPSDVEMLENKPYFARFRIKNFEFIDKYIEARICGWVEQALYINGLRNHTVKIEKSMAAGDQYTEFSFSWSD